MLGAPDSRAGHDIWIRNCTDKPAAVCAYNSNDPIEAVTASYTGFLRPYYTFNAKCNTHRCKINSMNADITDCSKLYWSHGKHTHGQHSLVWKQIKEGGKTKKVHDLVNTFTCERLTN